MIKYISSHQRIIRIAYILILIGVFAKIYSSIFDQKVNLAGDNASYYILGNALANGDGYTNIQHLEKEAHYHYPPGYPVLIAGVTYLFSNDIAIIKIVNGVLFLGSVLLLFFLIKELTQNDHIAFATSFITVLNYHLLGYATIMMSEIPFLFFSLLCLLLFAKLDLSKPIIKNWHFYVLLISLSFSFYIRSIGLALCISLGGCLFLKKQWRYGLSLVIGFILLYLPWMIRNHTATENTYMSQLSLKNPYKPELGSVGFTDLWERVIINLERYLTKEIPSGLAYSKDMIYSEASTPLIEWLLGFLLLGWIVFGIYRLTRFRIFILLYVLAFLSLLMLWPSIWYGTRFLVPLIPLLIFLTVFGVVELFTVVNAKIFTKKGKYFTPIFMLIMLGFWSFFYGNNSLSKLADQANSEYTKDYANYFEMADWIRTQTSDSSVTCVRKQGLFYLNSKKYVTGYQNAPDREAQIEYLKNKKVNYVVVEQLGYSSTSRYLVPAIDRYPKKFKIIKELKNPNTYLMQFLPELGYWGAWENEKRNGWGTYLWEDGQKYVGYWKNDVRHGKGTVYFKNGDRITGMWENGKLNGEVLKISETGEVIERSLYQNNEKVEVIRDQN